MAISSKGGRNVTYIARLQEAIRKIHGCESVYERTAVVREVVQGNIVWRREVEIVHLVGHPTASECYVWSASADGTGDFTAVLKLSPLDSPEKAVRAAIRAQGKDKGEKA